MLINESDMARLKSQISRGEVILFTGAGFSAGSKDRYGRPLPGSGELKRELWQMCYRDEPFDESSSLGDLYAAALHKSRTSLSEMLHSRFSVDPESLPEYFRLLLGFPWLRVYTINIDDLDSAAERRFEFERPIVSISARDRDVLRLPGAVPLSQALEVVHLNGMIPAAPEALTFSDSQYHERIANQEPWYARCVVDITSRPVIFIGTVLNESLFWHHMELRRRRETLGRDLRPTSLLITPSLPLPRRDVLRDLRIVWIQGTAEEFATQVLANLGTDGYKGFAFLRDRSVDRVSTTFPLASQLAAENADKQTEYLLGDEPQWSDILSGRAIERSHDQSLARTCEEILAGDGIPTAICVTGTAGAGKSTALMSLALKLSSKGLPVFWIDKDSNSSPSRIRSHITKAIGPVILAMDDADMYGRELVNMLADLVPVKKDFLFVFATRSSKLDEITDLAKSDRRFRINEHVVPPLSDMDIDNLIGVLEKNKRLGMLTGASHEARRAGFRDQAGRQLLVAMIQATSGENFELKAQGEYLELQGAIRFAYSLISVVTSMRQTITKDEILLAYGDSNEEALVALERLSARHLVLTRSPGEYRCRHRVIADLVFDKMKELGELKEVLTGLAWALGSKVQGPLDRQSRIGRLTIRVINHDFLIRTIGFSSARDLYTQIEPVLSSDYHFWLQRGSLEVEVGDIRKAENFLGAARSLGAGDFRVNTAYAYMLMRKACENPGDLHAEEYLRTGMEELESVIADSGDQSSYPFHVLGSQGLAWAHRGIPQRNIKREFLERLREIVEHGLRSHATDENLIKLETDLRKEILLTTVDPGTHVRPH
jgi:NAD-dependent SIR2 family protein deacetylase